MSNSGKGVFSVSELARFLFTGSKGDMNKSSFALCALLCALCSCSGPQDRIAIDEVLVEGDVTIIGNDIDCSKYEAAIGTLYVSKYECDWASCVQAFNYGLKKEYVAVIDNKIIPRVGLFPQFNNAIADIGACAEHISFVDGEIVCVADSVRMPVSNISWYGAALVCNILSEMNGFKPSYDLVSWEVVAKANGYRMPTFEEWEYIARGGKEKSCCKYAGANDPLEVGWFALNSGNRMHASGELKPNGLGLYDLSGNLNEFCTETYKPIITSAKTKGSALMTSNRIWRGGSFKSDSVDVYYFRQNINNPEYYFPFEDVGFRTVREK